MVKPAAKQTVTTYNSHSRPKQRCFFSSSFSPLFFFSSFPSSSPLLSSFPSSFHLLFPPHFTLYRNPTFCYFSYPFSVLLFITTYLMVIRLQRYAFIGHMTLLSSKSSGNPDDGGRNPQSAPLEFNMKNDGGRRDRSVHVNHGTSSDTGAL